MNQNNTQAKDALRTEGKFRKDKITVSLMRSLEKQVINGEISYSKMIEILNEYKQQPTESKESDVVSIVEKIRVAMSKDNQDLSLIYGEWCLFKSAHGVRLTSEQLCNEFKKR